MDNNRLSDGLLRQDGIDPHGVSETERAAFRDTMERHEAQAGHNRRVVATCLSAAAVGLSLLWLTGRVPDWLAIPYALAWTVLAGIAHFYFVSRWIARLAAKTRLGRLGGHRRQVADLQRSPLWAGGLRIAVAAVIVVVTLVMIRSARYSADPQETIVLGQASVFADCTAAFRIFVRDHAKSRPISGAQVRLTLEGNGIRQVLGEFATGEDGSLSDPIQVPPVEPGTYNLVIESRSDVGEDRIIRSIRVKRDRRVYVTTDKPLYQPGQTIHLRAMVLDAVSLKPAADQAILFEVFDSKGNKVFKAEPVASRHGIAACDFALAEEVNLGDYRIEVTAGEVGSARTVEVSRYVLPKFKVEVTTDKPFYLPSETVHGEVKTAYFFGKPVADAEVKVIGRILGQRPLDVFYVTGTASADGRFEFHAALGERLDLVDGQARRRANRDLEIAVTVRDGTGHEESALEERPVSRESINIYVFPEGGDFLEGVDNLIYLMTAYPDGRPAACEITVNDSVLRSDDTGIAVLTIQPDGRMLTLAIRAQDAAGLKGTRRVGIPTWRGNNDLLLRTDKAVYQAGETAQVEILAPWSSSVFLDVLRNGQTVLTKRVQVDAQGQGHLALDLSADLWGTLRLNAYAGVKSIGRIDMDTRVIHVNPADELRVAATLDQTVYRPGATARARLQVTDRDGAATPAALSLVAVDEAVFYVCGNRPGEMDRFFVADRRLPLADYQVAFAISPEQLLSGQEKYQNLAKALFSASAQSLARVLAEDEEREVPRYYADGEDYSLLTETHPGKQAEAAALRDQQFRQPFTLLALAVVMMIPLAVFSHSVFRALRQMTADVRVAEATQVSARTSGSTWLLALAILLPTVTFLTSILLRVLTDRYYHIHKRWLGFDPVLASIMVVALPLLAITGFPAISRLRMGRLRQMRSAATKGLILLAGGIALVSAVQYLTTRTLVESVTLRDEYFVLNFAIPALPIAVSLALCAIANATSAKRPGRFYAELGRSGHLVLLVLLSAGLVLSSRIPEEYPLRLFDRSFRSAYHRLDVRSDTDGDLAFLNYDRYAREEYMGGGMMGGMGGLGGAAPMRAVEQLPEPPRVRKHFPETLLWQPEVITDEQGRANVDIPLADSITTWKMNVDAVSVAGKLGNATIDVLAFQDFFVDLDVPIALTRNDEFTIPVLCYSYLQEPQTIRLTLEASPWYELMGSASQEVTLGPRETGSASFRIKATQVGDHELTVHAQSPSTGDAVRRSITIRPDGAEREDLQDGVLTRSAEHTFEVPPDAIAHSAKLLLKVYPSPFSEVLEGLEGILRLPHGCFEQTSSATYPNIMVLQYMRRMGQQTDEVEAKALQYIAAGYQRLLTFEVEGGGFEWFGRPPANTNLTAYGVLQFSDMSKVYDVDPDIIGRAIDRLSEQQNADGSWGDSSHEHSRVADTAYTAWALTEAGVERRTLDYALGFLRDNLRETDGPYTVALAANALLAQDVNDPLGRRLLAVLQAELQSQSPEGTPGLDGVGAMYSRGLCLDIETAALSALAMAKVNPHADMVRQALTQISEHKDRYGTWHSTQATVLAMKALLAGTRRVDGGQGATKIEVTVNDQPAGTLSISSQARDVLHMLDLTAHLKPGTNQIRLAQNQGTGLPYRLAGTYWTPQSTPVTAPAGELDIAVHYDKAHLRMNDPIVCSVQVRNDGQAPLNMVVVEVGIPPGFSVEWSAFDRLVESGAIARYDKNDNRVILYIRDIAARGTLEFRCRLTALYPMRIRIPPSRAYEYYRPENRDQTGTFEIVVQ